MSLETLAETPRRLRAIAESFAGDVRRRPSESVFSLLEQACHLRDIERLAFTERITRILAETEPELADVDGARVAAEGDYHATEDLAAAVDAFAALRAANLATLAKLTDEEWARTGILAGAGRITIRDVVRRMEQHDREHLAEVEAL